MIKLHITLFSLISSYRRSAVIHYKTGSFITTFAVFYKFSLLSFLYTLFNLIALLVLGAAPVSGLKPGKPGYSVFYTAWHQELIINFLRLLGMDKTVKELQKTHKIVGRKDELTSSLIAAKAAKHILLEGAVGVGKTTIALAVASHLEKTFVRIDGDERYTEQKLSGWFDPPLVLSGGYTEDSFIQGPLSTAMREGSILLINELNRMPEGTQNVLLTAMDEKTIFIPKYGKVTADPGFLLIATQNPDEYIGTSQLSEALKDRFICIRLSYQPEDEEREILRSRSVCSDEDIIGAAVSFARLTRNDQEIRRGSSIRGAIDLADIFHTAHGDYNDNIENWLWCARLAFRTKIELHDFSEDRFLRILEKLAQQALSSHKTGSAKGQSGNDTRRTHRDTVIAVPDEKKK